MSKFIGRQQEVGIAKEATRGTIVVPSIWIPKTNFTVEDKVAKAKFESGFGVFGPNGDDAFVALKWAEGDIEIAATDKTLGLLLYGLFGTDTPASYLSVYKHTLAIQQSVQPTTLSLFMNDPIGAAASPTLSMAYGKVMVNSFELMAELGELVKAKFGFVAMAHKDFAKQTPSYSTENKFIHNNVRVSVASAATGLDAAAKINVQSLHLKIERAVIRENALGTVQPVDILARQFKISGTLKLTHEDRTYRDYMLNGTKKAIRIDIVNGAVTIGTTNPAFRLDLPIVHFDQWAPAHPLDDVSHQEINFEALWDVTNSRLISDAYVVNSTASY